MSMIKVEHLTFSYPNSMTLVFEQVSFLIDTSWRLGFIGRNGRGKTTFFNLLLGKYDYEGSIQSSVQFDYFPYPILNSFRSAYVILKEICPMAEDWELIRELSYLEIREEILSRSYDTLSNGEQTKIMLAAMFLNENHFLLIDEPTNHLDSHSRRLVANYLKKKKGFIVVSHDRYFLDECVDHILSINRSNIEVQAGNYSSWKSNFEKQISFEESQNEQLKKDIKHLEAASRKTTAWSNKTEASKYGNGPVDRGFIGHKAAKMMKRSKVLETRQQQMIEQKRELLKNLEQIEDLKLTPLYYHSNEMACFEKVAVSYDDKIIHLPVSFSVCNQDRIFLVGKNGSGKSSLLKLLLEEKINYTGKITKGSNVIISYVPQDSSCLSGSLNQYLEQYEIDVSLFKAILRKMGFEREQFAKDLSTYSMGQKKKVSLARSLCERAHLYIWDEPLNYLDIESRIQLENLIKKYCPTMILVEHDVSFLNAVATKVIELK